MFFSRKTLTTRQRHRTPPANTPTMQVRLNTSAQRKAQQLFTSFLPNIVTEYNSREKKTKKQPDSKFAKVPTQKPMTYHQI